MAGKALHRSQGIAASLCVIHPALGLLAFYGVDNHWAPVALTRVLAVGSLLLTPTWLVWPFVLWVLRMRGWRLLTGVTMGLALELWLFKVWFVAFSFAGH